MALVIPCILDTTPHLQAREVFIVFFEGVIAEHPYPQCIYMVRPCEEALVIPCVLDTPPQVVSHHPICKQERFSVFHCVFLGGVIAEPPHPQCIYHDGELVRPRLVETTNSMQRGDHDTQPCLIRPKLKAGQCEPALAPLKLIPTSCVISKGECCTS